MTRKRTKASKEVKETTANKIKANKPNQISKREQTAPNQRTTKETKETKANVLR